MSREQLIRQNIDRATKAAASKPNTENKTPQGTTPVSPSHRTRFGANLDVVERLQLINFEQGVLGDGAMRGARAIIRKWKRPTTSQVIPSQPITTNNTGSSTSINPSQASSFVLSKELEDFAWNSNIDFLKFSNTINSPTSFFSADESKLKNLSFTFPKSTPPRVVQTSTSSPQRIGTPQPSNVGNIASIIGTTALAVGLSTLRSANPWGSIVPWTSKYLPSRSLYLPDGLDGKTRNFVRRSTWGTGTWETTPSPSEFIVGEELWQFLFNPSELEIEAGPEFKAAETWGVSDKANSGQPLNWSYNKNALLKFNSVLLNGYVFGRQVEDLEQGLYALFMSRDGEGQDGPPVLEFVWGDKIFGPCVIKNINVKEKQWDGGLVVNAEVSFTLEQIPEWTINDGFVDVARPGRQQVGGTIATPSAPQTPPAQTPPPQTPPTQAPPAQAPPRQPPSPPPRGNSRSPISSADRIEKCKKLRESLAELNGITSSPNLAGFSTATPEQARGRASTYTSAWEKLEANKLAPITPSTQSYSPSTLNSSVRREWERQMRVDPINKNKPSSQLPWNNNYRYPTRYVNELLGKAVGSVRGHIEQTQLSTCPK